MTREIRITIDDDEVFERMKRRKRELDLSWEEVLRRGLRRSGPGAHVEVGMGGEGWPLPKDFGDRIRRQVQRSIDDSLSGVPGVGDVGSGAPEGSERGDGAREDGLDDEIDRLAEAEDATLGFEFLDSESAAVPLRVNLRTGKDGLGVDVVAVRRGKGTAGLNRFDAGDRKAVTRRLARGETATLRFGPDETYAVVPELTWARDADGHPTVSDVEIVEVRLDEE